MIAIPDVSGITAILLKTEKAARFDTILSDAELVLAPDLFIPELTNTLWKHCVIRGMPEAHGMALIQAGIQYIDRFIDSRDLWKEAFTEGVHNKHSVYDMLYLVTARRNNGILITNDKALMKICETRNIQTCY